MPHPSDGIVLRAEDGSGAVRLRLAIADTLGEGAPGPFGSVFYECGNFEVIVPQRNPEDGALLMIHLLDATAPRRFEFDTTLPDGWTLRLELDGSVSVLDGDGEPVVFIGRPWAFDTDLHPVPVHYSLENGVLEQNISALDDTTFPVLVDPDPDAILTGDGRLITETWTPRLVAEVLTGDILPAPRTPRADKY